MTRIAKDRRRAVAKTYPPVKCSGTANTGQRCDQWAMVGANVCQKHGGKASQVEAARERRITLAEALARSDRRPPWEVLEHALHLVDVLLQDVLLDIQEQGTVTPQQYDKLVQAVERAHRLSKVNLDAGIDQRRLHLAEAQAGQIHKMFSQILDGLGLSAEQKALVPGLVKRVIEGEVRQKTIEAA